jgi:hypothetical protein
VEEEAVETLLQERLVVQEWYLSDTAILMVLLQQQQALQQ